MTLLNAIQMHGTIWGSATEPFWCELGAVGKINEAHPHVVANEYVCTTLASLAGIPAAHGAVLRDTDAGADGLVYVSFLAYPGGIDPPGPPTSTLVARQPKMCAAATVFDCWVMNQDRHRSNVVYSPDLKVPFTLIDFEGALVANGRDVTEARYRDAYFVGGQVHQYVTDRSHLDFWITRVQQIPDAAIERVCNEVASFGGMDRGEVEQVSTTLQYRKRILSRLITEAENDGRMLHLGGTPRLPI